MTVAQETTAPIQEQSKAIDFEKIEALRKYMLLTVDSMVKVYGTTRVSYYNWLKGKHMRATTAAHIRKVTKQLAICVAQHNWPNEMVFVASQAERLELLQNLIAKLDNPTE
jgi:hypothetical protein